MGPDNLYRLDTKNSTKPSQSFVQENPKQWGRQAVSLTDSALSLLKGIEPTQVISNEHPLMKRNRDELEAWEFEKRQKHEVYEIRFDEQTLSEDDEVYTMELPSGGIYTGQLRNGIKDGFGKETRVDGTRYYEGEYTDGEPEGSGKIYYDNGQSVRYDGFFKNGEFHGHGKIYDSQGNLYFLGKFLEGKPIRGKLFPIAGFLIYEGDFKNYKPNGQGSWYNRDGTVRHEGEFKDGKIASL